MKKQYREVKTLHLLTYLILPFLLLPAMCVIDVLVFKSDMPIYIRIAALVISVLVGYLLLKRLAIGAVLAYKAFAPMSVRDRCRFEPSCSSYMIMAINKYGLFIGVYKGIRRILRCRPPNGGVDYP